MFHFVGGKPLTKSIKDLKAEKLIYDRFSSKKK